MNDDDTKSFMALAAGAEIGQYRLAHRLGSGGMGEVYLAHDASLDRDVAVKFLSIELARHTESRLRFLREAQAAARLSHPNIVTIHEVSEHDGRPFFVMEHVDGRSLGAYAAGRQLPVSEFLDLAVQLCDAVQAAHARGVVHRDIKPSNILVDNGGRVRIVDFGLAAVAGVQPLTKSGSTLGTIGYMSPEQVYGREADHRSDLFSLGIVFYQLLTGMNPFVRDSEAATLHAIAHDAPPAPSSIRPEIPRSIDSLMLHMLEKEPVRRSQSAVEIRDGLISTRDEVLSPRRQPSSPSVAVLPFVNLSSDPDQEYFCDGVAEDIIGDLNHVPGLRVVARTSAFAFRGHAGDIRDVGRKLGVTHVVEGSVRKAGQRVRVAAQLIEVADGYQLWSERYDRELSDIFAIQDDISRAIVEKLKLELERLLSSQRGPLDVPIEAYQLYSRARHEMNMRSADSLRRALNYLQQCIRLAPAFAPARCGLADAYFLLYAYDYMTPRDAIAYARTSAQRALELDDRLADAHATLGGILTYYDWAWADAEQTFLRALELSPGHAVAHQWYGELLSFVGRTEEAAHHLDTALQRDPLSVVSLTMSGWHHVHTGQYDRALEFLEKAVALGTASDFTYALAGFCYFSTGHVEKGRAQFERSRAVSGSSAMSLTTQALAFERIGDLSLAQQALDQLLARQADEYVSQPYLAALYLLLGHEDMAVACLQEALRRRDAELMFMAVMPYYDCVQKNPRLGPLLAVLGLPSPPVARDNRPQRH